MLSHSCEASRSTLRHAYTSKKNGRRINGQKSVQTTRSNTQNVIMSPPHGHGLAMKMAYPTSLSNHTCSTMHTNGAITSTTVPNATPIRSHPHHLSPSSSTLTKITIPHPSPGHPPLRLTTNVTITTMAQHHTLLPDPTHHPVLLHVLLCEGTHRNTLSTFLIF